MYVKYEIYDIKWGLIVQQLTLWIFRLYRAAVRVKAFD
jgi:hypothetical protein